jgi:acetylornithine deacetylase/succinyl-diaminopimelate desuccinylase-like protein
LDEAAVGAAIASVDDAQTIEITRRLARVPAPLGEEGALAALVAEILDVPGVNVHVQAVVPGRPNVIATVRGRGDGPGLLLNAHLDSAVAPGSHRDPYAAQVEGDRLYAGGITDMKGPLAAMIAALRAAATLPLPPAGDLTLHAVMAHNPTGVGTKFALASEQPFTGIAIAGQGSGLRLRAESGGAIKWEIAFEGRAAHVSIKETGADALAAARRVADALDDFQFSHVAFDRLPGLPKFVVGELTAGGRAGVPALLPGSGVPDAASIRGDVRTVPGMTRWTVQADLDDLVSRVLGAGDVRGRTRIISEVWPFVADRSNAAVAAVTAAHTLVRGAPPEFASGLEQHAFVTDAPDLARFGLPTVGYGPGPWRYQADEFIELDELLDAARIYLATALLVGGS